MRKEIKTFKDDVYRLYVDHQNRTQGRNFSPVDWGEHAAFNLVFRYTMNVDQMSEERLETDLKALHSRLIKDLLFHQEKARNVSLGDDDRGMSRGRANIYERVLVVLQKALPDRVEIKRPIEVRQLVVYRD